MKIYCVFTCDVWKSRDSMSLCTACTSASVLREVLAAGIRAESFEFDDAATVAESATKFKAKWDENSVGDSIPWNVVNNVQYAFVEVTVTDFNPFRKEFL